MDDLPITAVLTATHGKTLLTYARRAITLFLQTNKIEIPETAVFPLTQKAGAFVTLWLKKLPSNQDSAYPGARLRGCIGHIQPDAPLYQIVPTMAVRAATADPRFPPMSLDELENIQIELSVLSQLSFVENVNSIEVGTHGLFIETNNHRGLLLPDVPARRQWNREQFLQAVCLKANLPPDFWQNKSANLSSFTTTIFEEPL